MAPRNSKSSPAPAAVEESRKTADALWLFEQFLNCDPPVSLNVMPISEKTGMKPNTIVKRINTFQHRYPGFGIVTRTTGQKQSSNLVPATPKVNTDSAVKKSAAKTTGRATRSKKVEAAEQDDEDVKENTVKEQAKTKKYVARGASDKKTKADREKDETQVSADDDDLNEPSNPPANKTSKETKSRRKSTSEQASPDSEDDADGSEDHHVEEEAPIKKTVTPKTRGGRKSAGIGEIKDVHADPEKTVPRGRHAVSRKDKVPDANNEKVETAKPRTEDSGKDGNDDLPNGTKRKRSVIPELQSSPLTPSPVIENRLNKMDSTEQCDRDGSHEGQLDSSDMPSPLKKPKTYHDSTEGDSVEIESMVAEAISSDAPDTSRAQSSVITNQEETSAEVEQSQPETTEASDTDQNTSTALAQDLDKSVTTPSGQNIDDIPSPSDEGDDSSMHAAENAQVIEAPESPTAGRGRSIELVPEISTRSITESTSNGVAHGSPTMNSDTERDVALLSNLAEEHTAQGSISKAPINRRGTPTAKSKAQEIAAQLMKIEATRPPRSFTEWMLYHPTAKPPKSK